MTTTRALAGTWIATLLLGLLTSTHLHAQVADREKQAERLFDEAQKAMELQQWQQACDKFMESQRLDPQLGTQLHLADCYEKVGRTASAWLHFRSAAELAAERHHEGQRELREEVAKRRMAELEPRLGTVTVIVNAPRLPGLTIQCDGRELKRDTWQKPKPLDPGKHVIVVTASRRDPWTTTITVSDAVHQVVEVPSQLGGVKLELLPVAAAATTAADAPLIAASNGQQGQLRLESSDNTAWNVAAYLSGSVGLVLLGTGVLLKLGEPTESAHAGAIAPCTVGASADDCAAQQRLAEEQLARADEASAETGTSATTRDLLLFGSGGALLIAGIALLVFQPRSRSTPAASLQLSLAPFSLSLRTTFF